MLNLASSKLVISLVSISSSASLISCKLRGRLYCFFRNVSSGIRRESLPSSDDSGCWLSSSVVDSSLSEDDFDKDDVRDINDFRRENLLLRGSDGEAGTWRRKGMREDEEDELTDDMLRGLDRSCCRTSSLSLSVSRHISS